jgi:NADPH:quinone reductase-like Zn-dependent oxidoreductase
MTTIDLTTPYATTYPEPITIENQGLPNASSSIGQIAAALAKAQGAMSHALKDSDNPHFKSKFADLAAVVDVIREPFAANGLSFIQRTRMADNGVTVTTILFHGESGEWLSDDGLFVPVSKIDAQGVGSAITYGRRYTLMAMAGLAPDDDDGNAAAAAAPTVAKLSKAQSDQLVAKLVEGGMTKAAAAANCKNVTAAQFDRALAKAQRLVDESDADEASTQNGGDS